MSPFSRSIASRQPLRRAPVARAVAVLATVTLLGGCAINPYIANTRPEAPTGTVRPVERLELAYAYANRTQDAYQAKMSEEFERQRLLSGGLITLGAAALGLAAFDVHRDVLVGAALVGGTGYALGTWNSNQGRLGIYLEGMKATACAKAAVAPLRLDDGQLRTLRDEIAAATAAANDVADAAGDVSSALSIAGAAETAPSELTRSAESELAAVPATLSKAGDLLTQAASLERRVGNAGSMLESRVDDIVRLVTGALNGTLADLAQLPKVIAGLSDYANVFAPGLDLGVALSNKVKAPQGAAQLPRSPTTESTSVSRLSVPDTSAGQLAAALGNLRAQTLRLSVRLPRLAGLVEPMSATEAKAALAGCGVDTDKAGAAMKLGRTTVQFVAGVAGTSIVPVTGGTLPLQVAFLDLPVKGITATVPPASRAVVLVADTGTAAGSSYRLNVSDAAGATAVVTVQVAAPGTEAPRSQARDRSSAVRPIAPQGAASRTPAPGNACQPQGRSAEAICLAQLALKVPLTGVLDAGTCAAMRKESAPLGDGLLNATTMDEVAARTGYRGAFDALGIRAFLVERQQTCPVAAAAPAAAVPSATTAAPASCATTGGQSAFECSLTSAQLGTLRQRLKQPAAPARFDDALRQAIRTFQKEQGIARTDGILDEATQKKLQATVPLP